MNSVIIYAHPWDGSYNYGILKNLIKNLENKGESFDIIDLNKDNFNPVLNEKELSLYANGKFHDPLVENYQKRIEKADQLFFIFPIWWFDLPAILKGFMDKVLLKYWAFDTSNTIPEGKLKFIKKTTVISTMNSPGWYYNLMYGNSLKNSFIKGTLKFCGLRNIKWINITNVSSMGEDKRKKWLKKIKQI